MSTRNRSRRPRPPAVDPDLLAAATRARLHALVAAHGRDYTPGDDLAALGPAGDCWGTAWALSAATGTTYVEGEVRHPSGALHAHAWCVDALGRVLDPTEGYAGATGYRGFVIDRALAEEATATWEGPRSSVIEAALWAGAPDEWVLSRLVVPA